MGREGSLENRLWDWSLPLEPGPDGTFSRERPRSFVDTARLVLEVVPGERRLLPEFGWRGHFLPDLESPAGQALGGVFAEEDLSRWAPDLGVERVDVIRVDGDEVHLVLFKGGSRHPLRVRRRAGGEPS